MKQSVSVIVLTFNEELNLEQCLKSVSDWANEIFVVDSYGVDKTRSHIFYNLDKQCCF